jgi:hypothetical protein
MIIMVKLIIHKSILYFSGTRKAKKAQAAFPKNLCYTGCGKSPSLAFDDRVVLVIL